MAAKRNNNSWRRAKHVEMEVHVNYGNSMPCDNSDRDITLTAAKNHPQCFHRPNYRPTPSHQWHLRPPEPNLQHSNQHCSTTFSCLRLLSSYYTHRSYLTSSGLPRGNLDPQQVDLPEIVQCKRRQTMEVPGHYPTMSKLIGKRHGVWVL